MDNNSYSLNNENSNSELKQILDNINNISLDNNLDKNLELLISIFGKDIGLEYDKFNIFNKETKFAIVYIDSIADKSLIDKTILGPLQRITLQISLKDKKEDIISLVLDNYLPLVKIKRSNKLPEIISEILQGNTIILFDNCSEVIEFETHKFEMKKIGKPENEKNIFASNEAFTENLDVNMGMVIKRLSTPYLRFESFNIGEFSNTKCKLLYVYSKVDEKVLDMVRKKLNNINYDIVGTIGKLAMIVEGENSLIFPTYKQTERPDFVIKRLMQGNVIILCDNAPFAIIIPITFWDNFKTTDDYSEASISVSFFRIIRVFSFFTSFIISPLYLAFVTYNHTIVPPNLALNISSGREGVPFPSVIELIALTIIIDIIKEAGMRMTGYVGYFIGTISAIIIGQSAVSAGYISTSIIIVVALSAVSCFAVGTPLLVNASRILNYFLILWAGFLGMFGLLNGLYVIIWRMVSLETFGIPYLYPFVPFDFDSWKDTLIRVPFKYLKKEKNMLSSTQQTGDKNEL